MVRFLVRLLLILPAAATAFSVGPSLRAQDGLYADFETSLGNFSCKLAFDKAPRTVANFVGLISGSGGWVDFKNGEAKNRPFYDGVTFHRVVAGFVIQGGSPKGDGTDGPGYTFQDEFDPALRHSRAGILSMANSGPNSNGSQFFVTLAAASHLDDVHSVFGEVSSGMEVVNAIGSVATDANGRPNVPVTMNRVTIRRIGAAANAFDSSAHAVPQVRSAGPVMMRTGANFFLRFPRAIYREYLLFQSGDLVTWSNERVGLYVSTPPATDLDVSAGASGQSRRFYRVAEITYPGPLFTPPSLIGKQMHLVLSSTETLDLVFTSPTGGTSNYTTSQGSTAGTITNYTWTQEAYRGRLFVQTTNVVALSISNVFVTDATGSFKGTAFGNLNQFPISGTFTFATPPGGALPLAMASPSSDPKTAARRKIIKQQTQRRASRSF
ncbi:MAG TPA: peptidylprolyl isomerase [Chthoniobacteraceae bacterium]|nr:peptidylprolyl isomerase [Chthoniobacteraceae bacterium]